MRGKFSNWGEPTAAVACVLFLMLFALLPVARLAIELVLGLLGDQRAAMVGRKAAAKY